MDLTLSADQQAFAVVAREFLDKEVVPYRAEWDRAEAVDTAIIPKLGEIGFFGLTIPVEYGGIGGDNITYCVAMEELGRADSRSGASCPCQWAWSARRCYPTAARNRSSSGFPRSRPAQSSPASP